jgi:hypothetical protein
LPFVGWVHAIFAIVFFFVQHPSQLICGTIVRPPLQVRKFICTLMDLGMTYKVYDAALRPLPGAWRRDDRARSPCRAAGEKTGLLK